MINLVNEAINRKLASISFTNIITGKVISVKPLEIRINDRIVIGQNFIEPMSLGLNDYSPNSALPLVVGEVIQMIRYNNGQRFYILGKSVDSSTIDIDYKKQVYNKPSLDTTSNKSLNPLNEEIKDTISLHKIAKTGSYDDLNNIPSDLPHYEVLQKLVDKEIIKFKNELYLDSTNIVHNQKILADIIYPIGSIYISVNDTSPEVLFGGTWVKIEKRFLWATVNSPKTVGGSLTTDEHTLSIDEIPSHEGHLFTTYPEAGNANVYLPSSVLLEYGDRGRGWSINTGNEAYPAGRSIGGGQGHTHTFMPPYFKVYMWFRTA